MVYLDDILIFSKSKEEYHRYLEQVVERLQRVGLYANTKKCDFYKTEIDFLGFIVDRSGLRMDPSRVEAISVTTLTVTTSTTRLASLPRSNHMASDTVD